MRHKEEPDFNRKQLERMDEIENAVYDACLVLTEREDCRYDYAKKDESKVLPWSVATEIADTVASILVHKGYSVRYPFRTEDEKGNVVIQDYVDW